MTFWAFWDRGERISYRLGNFCRKNGYRRKVAFMHIPKCAGSSIMESLRHNHKSSWDGHINGPETRMDYLKYFAEKDGSSSSWEIEQAIYKHRQTVLLEKFKIGAPIISGHVPFFKALKNDYPDYYFFTVVRNPIDRWISYFNFGIKRELHKNITLELVDSKGINYIFDQILNSEAGFIEAHTLSQFFSETISSNGVSMVDEISMDMTIDMFDYIGHAEKIDELREVLQQEKVLRKRDTIGRHNLTSSGVSSSNFVTFDSLSLKQKSQLESLCAADCKFYQEYLK